MNILEKILEEIERTRKSIIDMSDEEPELVDVEDWFDEGVDQGKLIAYEVAKEIIISHMDEAKDTNVLINDDMEEKIREHIAECLHRIDNIRSFIGSKEYTNNDEKCIRNIEVLKTIITALEGYLSSKKKSGNDGWIPVDERLPEEGQKVLVWYEYFRYGEYNRMFKTYGIGWQFDGHWSGDVSGTKARCIAWQPLPEWYKGGDDRA